ncbi:M1 family metallopeptidase [Bacteroidota bacterium]
MRSLFIYLILIGPSLTSYGQWTFTRQDSLRGTLNEFRSNFDVYFYDLTVEIDPEHKSIQGQNQIYFKAGTDLYKIQLDLFSILNIDSVHYKDQLLRYEREGNAFFIQFPKLIKKGSLVKITVFYHGTPIEASHPPWDGGFIWHKDSIGRDWIGIACEGLGASSWWPNKDHLSDEPDSMSIHCIAPSILSAISNGRLRSKKEIGYGKTKWSWFVGYPINNYNVSLNLAHYMRFTDAYNNGRDNLDLDYYVLDYNFKKAKAHFNQVKGMLESFEYYLGPFPFWKDSYKLIEVPYWGMEHQSAIAYGNEYENNAFGFDFIIIHESAHEYFGNSVSCSDHAELWIHEAFATYMEALYLEYHHDFETSVAYLETQKQYISNNISIIGPLGVNFNKWQDADMYYKGSWMLHSIRNTIEDDSLWFTILFDLYNRYRYSNVNSDDIINFVNNRTEHDLLPIFKQYLETTLVPILNYKINRKRNGIILKYNWSNVVEDFNMPVVVRTDKGDIKKIFPNPGIQKCNIKDTRDIIFATELYYFQTLER